MPSYSPYTPGRSPCTYLCRSQIYPGTCTMPWLPPRMDYVKSLVTQAGNRGHSEDVLHELGPLSALLHKTMIIVDSYYSKV